MCGVSNTIDQGEAESCSGGEVYLQALGLATVGCSADQYDSIDALRDRGH
jgi:hypothetical protein